MNDEKYERGRRKDKKNYGKREQTLKQKALVELDNKLSEKKKDEFNNRSACLASACRSI